MENLSYKPIKKTKSGNYISYIKLNNNSVVLKVDNLIVIKEMYKTDGDYFIDVIVEEKTHMILNKLKTLTLRKFYSQFNKDGDLDYDDFEKMYINNHNEENVYTLKVNKKCLFISENEMGERKSIHYNEIKEEHTINVVLIFHGVVFGQSEMSNEYIITKITKNIQIDIDITDCFFNGEDMKVDTSNSDDEDDITMNDKFLKNINGVDDSLNEQFKLMCLE
jgi:hypothetical protein